jgi:hypothetical protein
VCGDGHHGYKKFAKDNEMEFLLINTSKGQKVRGDYHIQHVNSTHKRIKKWIDNTF